MPVGDATPGVGYAVRAGCRRALPALRASALDALAWFVIAALAVESRPEAWT
jgi:hypothetical protein